MHNEPLPDNPTGFSNMPGGGKFVVVLLWVRFGLGICASIGLVTLSAALNDDPTASELLPDWYGAFTAFTIVQTVVWVVLYAVFAVKLTQASETARRGTIVLEGVGLLLAAGSFLLLQGTYSDLAAQGADFTGTYASAFIGAVLSLVVIAILNGRDMRAFCAG
jgi:tryptophan-rich sensory protein